MEEGQLTRTLDDVFSWALENNIKSVATNGIANTDHGRETEHNRRSDEQRARFLVAYATNAEHKYGINIELISLNDVFVRVG